MSTNHNRIKVSDLETNERDKILKTNLDGELEFCDVSNLKTENYNDLDCNTEGKALDARQGKVLKDMIDNGSVNIASDLETQINTLVPEDKKIVSRSKLFNWWQWIKDQSTTITGDWTFTGSLKANTNKEINLNTTVNFDYYTGSSSIKVIHSKNVANENGIYLKTNGDLKLEGENLDINNSHYRGRIYDNGHFCIDGQSIPLNLSGESVQIGWQTYIQGQAYYNNSEIATLNDIAETYQEQNCGPFTNQDLNDMYRFAKKGFRLNCIYALGGPVCYEKLDTGYWAKYSITLL